VLSNLIDNALKHTPPDGSVTLTCVARGDVVELAVADTGPGIPAEALPHVFEWYWQASHERTAGAGIGLAVSRSIVEAHGGQIWAETEPGVGTTIRLTLPIVPAHGRPAGSAAARPAHVATTEAEHSRG